MKKSSFLYGSLILASVNFIIRIIGFAYKIILSKLIGAEGIGLFQMVFPVLMMFITITTAGIPIAVSKLVSKYKSSNALSEVKKVFYTAFTITLLLSITLSSVLIIFRRYIALSLLKNSEISLSVLLLAPAVVIISLSSLLRGYFYGLKQISPAGVSQVIEQIGRIVFVLGLIYYSRPIEAKEGAFIAVCGISVGELLGLLWMLLQFKIKKMSLNNATRRIYSRRTGFINTLLQISYIAIPITIARMINVFLQLINAIIIPQRLMVAGYSTNEAVSIFGRVTGMSMPLIFLPFVVTSALVINIIPNISEEMEQKRYTLIRNNIGLSIRVTLLVSIPLTAIYIFFAEPIGMFFYGDSDVGEYLKIMGFSTVFLSLQHTLSGILQGLGKQVRATINYLVGMSLQLYCTYYLVAKPTFGIWGFFIGFVGATIVISALNFHSVDKIVNINLNLGNFIIKPFISTVIMAIIIALIYSFFSLHNIKEYFTFMTCGASGLIVYLLTLFILKGIPPSLLRKIT